MKGIDSRSSARKRKCDVEENQVDDNLVQKLLKVNNFSVRPVKQRKIKKKSADDTNFSAVEKEEQTRCKEVDDLHPAVHYLVQWNQKRTDWKFKKVRQTWLLKNMYDKEKIGKEYFKILLKYIDDIKGNSRDFTLLAAQEIVEKETESDKRRLKRATKVLKLLS